jgi:hypothetical protein
MDGGGFMTQIWNSSKVLKLRMKKVGEDRSSHSLSMKNLRITDRDLIMMAILTFSFSNSATCDIVKNSDFDGAVQSESAVTTKLDDHREESAFSKRKSLKDDRVEEFTTTGQEAEKLKARWAGKVIMDQF